MAEIPSYEQWMKDTHSLISPRSEFLKKLIARIQPALEKARTYIQVSRLEIPGMAHAKGVVEQNYSVKTGISKVTGAPGALKDKISNGINVWFDKPEKPPKVDKSRIVGFGSS